MLRIVAAVPPGRVVGFADVGAPKSGAGGETRRALLAAGGAAFDAEGRITGFVAGHAPVAALPHGVPRQARPVDAPVASSRKARRAR